MEFFGVGISQWASLVTVLGAILTLFMWLFKAIIKSIISDLTYQIKSLGASIKLLSNTTTENQKLAQQHHEDSQRRLMEHDIKLEHVNTTIDDHEERIKGIEDDIDVIREKCDESTN